MQRILSQYAHFGGHPLAVRGETLGLVWSHRSDTAGNETTNLELIELDDDGRVGYHGRFDEDDFEAAYRELERRYYAGEGAAFTDSGMRTAEYVVAMNRGDFDTMFGELSSPDLRVENRSRSGFPDRSAIELRAGLEELNAMVASVHAWFSTVRWLSPTLFVGRLEREAVGRDGEQYAWARILVGTWRDGRLASLCDFDAEDEEAAVAYAEERIRT